MTNQKQIKLTTENLLEIARDEDRWSREPDEDKLHTVASRALEILGTIYWSDDADEAPEIDARTARRVVYQVAQTYTDAVYTAERRVSSVLSALRGM